MSEFFARLARQAADETERPGALRPRARVAFEAASPSELEDEVIAPGRPALAKEVRSSAEPPRPPPEERRPAPAPQDQAPPERESARDGEPRPEPPAPAPAPPPAAKIGVTERASEPEVLERRAPSVPGQTVIRELRLSREETILRETIRELRTQVLDPRAPPEPVTLVEDPRPPPQPRVAPPVERTLAVRTVVRETAPGLRAAAPVPPAVAVAGPSTIQVTIGRVEIRAAAPPAAPAAPQARPRPGLSLEEYLRRGQR